MSSALCLRASASASASTSAFTPSPGVGLLDMQCEYSAGPDKVTDSNEKITVWNSTTAVKCAVVLVITSFAVNVCIRFGYQHAAAGNHLRLHPYAPSVISMLLTATLWLSIGYLFLRPNSLAELVSELNLEVWPSVTGFVAGGIGIGIGAFTLFGVSRGWIAPNGTAHAFHNLGGPIWAFFVLHTIIIAPFYEETLLRGVLFKAFRGSLPLPPSATFVVAVQAYFHWTLFTRDSLAFLILISSGILLCVLQERTQNLWNCVLLHSAYNATVTRQLPVWLIIVVLLCTIKMGRGKEEAPQK
jgi:membrane protease YdiL (CAAX protease family)